MGRGSSLFVSAPLAAVVSMVVFASGAAAVPTVATSGVAGEDEPRVTTTDEPGDGSSDGSSDSSGDEPGERVLVPELSTETSTTHELPSGEFELNASTVPINYLTQDGEWAPIDTTLVAPEEASEDAASLAPADNASTARSGAGEDEVAAVNAAAAYAAEIPADGEASAVRFGSDRVEGVPGGEAWVSMKLEGMTGAPTVEGDTATFATTDDLVAGSVELATTGEGLKETIVVDQRPDFTEAGGLTEGQQATGGDAIVYRYELTTSEDVTPQLTPDQTIQFVRDGAPRDAADRVVFEIPRGNMFDSADSVMVGDVAADGPAYSSDVAYELNDLGPGQTTTGQRGWELLVRPDMAWMADEAREYPVMIDPTVTFGPVRDCSLMQDNPDASRCGNAQQLLRVGKLTGNGNIGDRRRAALLFNIGAIPRSNARQEVTLTHSNLELHLAPNQTDPGNETGYVVQRAVRTFNNQATWRSDGTTGWFGGTPQGPERGLNQLNGNGPVGWRYFDVTPMVREWHSGGVPNTGMILKQRTENVRSELAFRSSSNQNAQNLRPNLNVIYTIEDNAPLALTATDQTVTQGQQISGRRPDKPKRLGASP